MDLQPSKDVLRDFNKVYEGYIINKTLLYYCKQSVFNNDQGLDAETKDYVINIIEDVAVQEYTLLKNDTKNHADVNLLGLFNKQINVLSKPKVAFLIRHIIQLMKSTYSNDLKKLNAICHDELTKTSPEANLEYHRMSLHEQLYNHYSSLRKKRLQRIELIKQFLDLKNKLILYDSTHAIDLLEQDHMIEDARITLLQHAAKRRIFKSSQAIEAASIVLQDIESEIQRINDKIKKLQT